MNFITLIILVVAICTTIAFLSQVIKVIKTKGIKNIYLLVYTVIITGLSWLTYYGSIIKNTPLIMLGAISFVMALIVLIFRMNPLFFIKNIQKGYRDLETEKKELYISYVSLFLVLITLIITMIFNIKSNNSTKEALGISQNLVSISRGSLDLLKLETDKLNDPFFSFEYVKDKELFKITHPDDVTIRGVEWYFQDATNDFRFGDTQEKDRFIQLDENSSELKLITILDYLTDQILSQNKNLTSEQAKYFVKCYDRYYPAHVLSAIATIFYNKRGNTKNEWIDKYIYFDRVFSIYPRIFELENIDSPEINRQFFDFEKFKNYLALPALLDWKLIPRNEITETIPSGGGCSLFPGRGIIGETYRYHSTE